MTFKLFFSPTTLGFHSEFSHGTKKITVNDPDWVRPNLENGEPDETAQPNQIEIDNPDCKIPADGIEVTESVRDELLLAESQGGRIQVGADGLPFAFFMDFAEPPITVSAWQIRKALNQLNLRQSVESAVANSTNQDLKDGWEYAKEFIENEPLVLEMAQDLSLTEAQLHDLFDLAKGL